MGAGLRPTLKCVEVPPDPKVRTPVPHPTERGEDDLSRGIPSPKSRKSDDPVLRTRAILSHSLKPLGSYSQAVLFPNIGG